MFTLIHPVPNVSHIEVAVIQPVTASEPNPKLLMSKKTVMTEWLRLCTKRSSGAELTPKEQKTLEECEAALNRDEARFDEMAEAAAEGRLLPKSKRAAIHE